MYDLRAVVYAGTKTPVTIICPDHGAFEVTPDAFIYSGGCKRCRGIHPRGYPARRRGGVEIKKKRIPGPKPEAHTFYIHQVSGGFLKIGITSGNVESRRIQIELASDFNHAVIFTRTFLNRPLCAAIERAIKKAFRMRVAPEGSMRDGITETVATVHLDAIKAIVSVFPNRPVLCGSYCCKNSP